jgi:hypothetical protein
MRFGIEVGASIAGAGLFVLTLSTPTWIEAAFGFDVDGGNGLFEWLIAAAFLAVPLILGLIRRSERRRLRPRPSQT